MRHISLVFLLLLFANCITAQSINKLDDKGERDGFWKGNFENTNEPRFEGTFKNGKEMGIFKFYKLVDGKSKLSATREFLPNSDKINVKFFSSQGKLISEGIMKDKIFIGKWVYYQNKNKGILTVENYNETGILEGEKMVYYENGQIAEKSIYVNGEIDGTSMWYSPNGKTLKEFTYRNGELHGIAKYYDINGLMLAEGIYRNDQKHGIWKYYENGEFKEEKDFTTYSKNPKKQ